MARPRWRTLLPAPVRRAGRKVLRLLGFIRLRVWPNRRPPCVVGIPMMNLHESTARVIEDLDFDDIDEVIIFDHASDDPAAVDWLRRIEREPKVTVYRRGIIPEESLYRSWNDAIRLALSRFDSPQVDVVLLNNDVRLPRGFVRFLTKAMRFGDPTVMIAYPDAAAKRAHGLPRSIKLTRTRGLHADGGMTGWAFAVRAEAFRDLIPFIDERLKFYSGDRDLVHAVETRGYTAARVEGLACEHSLGATRKRRPELVTQQRRDMALWWKEHSGAALNADGACPGCDGGQRFTPSA